MPVVFKVAPLPVLFTVRGMVRCDWLSGFILQRKETGVCRGLEKKGENMTE